MIIKIIHRKIEIKELLINFIKSLDKVELVPQKKSVELCGTAIFHNMR